MYRAKEQGRNCAEFFKPDLHIRLLKRALIEGGLREALRLDRFRLDWLPKIAIGRRCLVGAEVLLRWRDPELGEISPGEFPSPKPADSSWMWTARGAPCC